MTQSLIMSTLRILVNAVVCCIGVAFYGCEESDARLSAVFPTGLPTTLKLVEMSGNIASVPPLVGEDLPWQEEINFSVPNKFVKIRSDKTTGKTERAEGFFVIESFPGDPEMYIALTYRQDNPLIASCIRIELKEYLKVERLMVNGTWSICDGPGLHYRWMESPL